MSGHYIMSHYYFFFSLRAIAIFLEYIFSPLIHVDVLCFKTLCWEILISYVVRLTTQNLHSLGLLQQVSSILIHDRLIKIRTKYTGRTFSMHSSGYFFSTFSSAHQVETIARNLKKKRQLNGYLKL